MKNSPSTPQFPPTASVAVKITVIYFAVGILWILFSDAALGLVVRDPSVLAGLGMAKGCFYVAITALMLYLLVRRGIAQITRDLAELKQAQQTLQEREEALRCANRELRAITDCNQVLLRATDEQSLLRDICRIVCDEAGYRVAWVGYAEHDEAKCVRRIASAGVEEEYLAKLDITWADTERGRGPCGTAIRTGKTSCLADYVTDPRGAPWREMALQHGVRSGIGLPLKDEQANIFGSLNIYSAEPNAFTSEEIRLLEELAGDLAFGIVTLRSRAAREQAEQKLSLLNFAMDRVRDAAFLIDEQGRCRYANENASRILGYDRAEMLGMRVADLDPDFPAERWPDHWRELKERQTLMFESRHRTREGRVFPVEVSASFFEYEGRSYNLALVRDITSRKRAEEERRESAERFRAIADYTYDWENWIGVDGKLLWVNPAVERITGYSVGDCMAMPDFPLPIVAEADRESLALQMREAVQGSSRNDFEFRVRHKDGQLVWVAASWQPIYDTRGARLGHRSSMRDISDRKRAEEALRETEAYLTEAQRLSHTGSWAFDIATNKYVYASEECLRIFELHAQQNWPSRDAVSGLIHPEDWDRTNKGFEKAVREKVDALSEFRIVLPTGVIKHVRAIRHPVLNDAGEVVKLIGTVVDITERKRAEDALRRSEAYLAEGQKLAHMGSWAWSPATRQSLYWSEEMCRIFGFDPKDGLPTAEAFWQRIHPEDLDRTRELLFSVAAGNTEYEHEHRIVLPDGTVKHIHAIGHPVLDQNGQVVEYIGTAIDVTERKQIEEELRKHQEHLEELVKQRTEELAVLNQLVYGSLEAADVGAWWIDFKESDTCHALDNTARMLGWQPDPTGKKTYKLSDWNKLLADTAAALPEYAPNIEETHERFAGVVSGKYENYRAVYPLALPDGSLKWIDGRAEVAKRDEHGQALLMTGTFIDVTRSKRAEADLAEAKARAETANRAKSSFLANMSHELRTPLNAVLGFSRLLKNDPAATPQQRETLDIIVRSGEHLLNLINTVLDMAKIEAGQVGVKESEVDLHRLLHDMQSIMGAGAVEKGLRFALELDPDLPRFVAVDADKLRQVLLNLLGNAIKYTDSGGVKLRARPASVRGTGAARVRFEVEDSGPGISQENCERVFLPFVQVGAPAPVHVGTGLGLAICKQYVELMGGRIGVDSEPGRGSVFHFTIPVNVVPSLAEPDEPMHGWDPLESTCRHASLSIL